MFLYAFVKGLKGVLSKKAYGEKYSMAVWALQGGVFRSSLILSYLLILLLFVASIRGKLLKTTHTEGRSASTPIQLQTNYSDFTTFIHR